LNQEFRKGDGFNVGLGFVKQSLSEHIQVIVIGQIDTLDQSPCLRVRLLIIRGLMEKPLIGLDEKGFHTPYNSPFYGLLGLLEKEALGGPQGGLFRDQLLEVQEETE